MSYVREGAYRNMFETRLGPTDLAQLDKIADMLDTTRTQLMRFMIENAVYERYSND